MTLSRSGSSDPPVAATPEALETIERLRAAHGDLALFQSGGCCDGSSPICLEAADMPPGPDDLLLGTLGGAPFYIDAEQYRRWRSPRLILDVRQGPAEGFSLEGLEGVHFVTREESVMASDTVPANTPSSGIEALERWLRDEGVEHRVLAHDPTFDARHEAYAAWVPAEQTVKTLVLCDGDELVVVAIPASERLDLHKLRTELGRHQTLRLATEAEIALRFAGYQVGAIPPLGLEAVDVHVVDRRLLTYNRVLCSAGDHRHSLLLDAEDLVAASQAVVADVCAAHTRR